MEKVIITLKKAKALEILNDLAKRFYWTFYKITNNDIVFVYSYHNGTTLEQVVGIFLRANNNNKEIEAFFNDQEIKNFAKKDYYRVISDFLNEIKLYIKALYPRAI